MTFIRFTFLGLGCAWWKFCIESEPVSHLRYISKNEILERSRELAKLEQDKLKAKLASKLKLDEKKRLGRKRYNYDLFFQRFF